MIWYNLIQASLYDHHNLLFSRNHAEFCSLLNYIKNRSTWCKLPPTALNICGSNGHTNVTSLAEVMSAVPPPQRVPDCPKSLLSLKSLLSSSIIPWHVSVPPQAWWMFSLIMPSHAAVSPGKDFFSVWHCLSLCHVRCLTASHHSIASGVAVLFWKGAQLQSLWI